MKNESRMNRILNSRLFWVIVSLFAAILLWLYVTSTEGVTSEKRLTGVKVVFVGADALRESSGLIVTEQDSETVDLTLSGERRFLNRITSANVTATVDLANVKSRARYSISYDITYPDGIKAGDITVVNSSTDVINFYVDALARKTVEVKGDFTGNTAEGFLAADAITFDPLAVVISGPQAVLDTIDCAYVSITREGVDKTLKYATTYELLNMDGKPVTSSSITREIEEVNVTLSVLSTKSVPLDVTIIDGGGATRTDNADIKIVPESIVLAGDAQAISETTKLILGTVDLSDFATDFVQTYTIVPPNSTENLTGIAEATVTITVHGLATRVFEIKQDSISCINVPAGYTAEVITQKLMVTLRAPEEILGAIRDNSLRAVADLTDATVTPGAVLNPAVRVYIDGFPEAGYVGDYKIHVTVND